MKSERDENHVSPSRTVCSRDAFIGQVTYPPGGWYGPRNQADFQLVIIHSGHAKITVDDEHRVLPSGSVMLLLPGHREYFAFAADCETRHSWCTVDAKAMPAIMAGKLTKAATISPVSCTFDRLLSTGISMAHPLTMAADDVISRLAMLLFAEFLRMAENDSNWNKSPEPLNRALGYMEDHLAEHDCLAGAFRYSGASRSALIQYFARDLGLTPGRYLWKLRIQRGIAMLGQTGLTISEIAYQCGFKTPFHFSRMVKQQQGLPPREMRRQAWDQFAGRAGRKTGSSEKYISPR